MGRVGKGNLNQSQSMEKKKAGKTLTDVLASAHVEPSVNDQIEQVSLEAPEELREATVREVSRILDEMTDRTCAILKALGVECGGFHAKWRPLEGFEGLPEKLAQVEIIPEVRVKSPQNHV